MSTIYHTEKTSTQEQQIEKRQELKKIFRDVDTLSQHLARLVFNLLQNYMLGKFLETTCLLSSTLPRYLNEEAILNVNPGVFTLFKLDRAHHTIHKLLFGNNWIYLGGPAAREVLHISLGENGPLLVHVEIPEEQLIRQSMKITPAIATLYPRESERGLYVSIIPKWTPPSIFLPLKHDKLPEDMAIYAAIIEQHFTPILNYLNDNYNNIARLAKKYGTPGKCEDDVTCLGHILEDIENMEE